MRDFLAEGREVTAVRYLAARDAARRYAAGIAEIFTQYDAILTPATHRGCAQGRRDRQSDVLLAVDARPGLPALTLPLLTGEGGMPLGVQLVGPAGDDARLLRTANWLINRLAR